MEFENDNSLANQTPNHPMNPNNTPQQTKPYTVPQNSSTSFQNFQMIPNTQNLFTQGFATNNLFTNTTPLQMNTQQFFQPVQQQQQQQDHDDDQDYVPSEEEESSSSEEEEVEEIQEEEQFDDPDFDLQAYLKVRDQL